MKRFLCFLAIVAVITVFALSSWSLGKGGDSDADLSGATGGVVATSPAAGSATPIVGTTVDLGGGQVLTFVDILAGMFTMGSPSTAGYSDEKPQHQVTLSAFQMQTTEVTQAQYKQVMGNNPSYFIPTQTDYSSGYANTDTQPVETVSWYDAVRFCNKVSTDKGFVACYTNAANSATIVDGDVVTCNWSANGLRLPTEAEWEYACRAGTTTTYYWGNDATETGIKPYCWYYYNAYSGGWTEPHAEKGCTQPVGTKLPNAFGLYDMSGNVYEWCWDWYGSGYYSTSPGTDPKGTDSGSYRVLRGGCWSYYDSILRSADRGSYLYPGGRYGHIGFRVARTK